MRLQSSRRWRVTTRAVLAFALLACGDGPTDPKPVPVGLVSIAGAPTTPVLVGGTLTLVAIPRAADGTALTGREVEWTSSAPAVAEVSGDGLVRTLAPGLVTIVATSEGIEATAPIDVRVGGTLGADGGTLGMLGGAIAISAPAGALARAQVVTAAAVANPPADPRLVAGSAYELAPTDLTFAMPAAVVIRYDPARLPPGIGESGLALYTLEGTTWTRVPGSTGNIATNTVSGLVSRLGTFAVVATPVARVTVVPPAGGKVYVGQQAYFTVAMYDAMDQPITGRLVTWASSDTAKLRPMGNGMFTGVATGDVTVTATVEGKTATATVTVAEVPAATLVLSPARAALLVNQQLQLLATVRDAQGNVLTGRTITWSTSSAARATVSAAGVVTGRDAGAVTITATVEGINATSMLTVLPPVTADWSRAAEWVTHQGNARHTGYVAAVVDPATFEEKWVAIVAAGAALSPATAGNGTVFAATRAYFGQQRLTALDAATGAALWSYNFGGIHGVHEPAYGNGRVYITTSGHSDSFLWSFDPKTGQVLSRSAYGNQWSTYFAPVVEGSTVYMAGGYYGGMYAFDASDGTQRWFVATNQYDLWTPAVADGRVYAYTGSYSPKVSVHDAATGALSYEIADPGFSWNGWSMNTAPVLGGQNDLLATQAGRLVSFDLQARTIRWQRPAAGYRGTPAVANGTIYVIGNGQVEARRETDGAQQWLWIPPQGRPSYNLVVTDNLLFVSTETTTYALDLASQLPVWSYPAGGNLALSSQGLLLISKSDGGVVAVTVR